MGECFLVQKGGASFNLIEEEGYELLADIEVTSATTSVDISGLNIGKGDEVVLVSDQAVTTAYNLLYINGNTTSSNYFNQDLRANDTSILSARISEPTISDVVNSGGNITYTIIKLTNNGYFVYQSSGIRNYGGSSNRIQNYYGTSTFTASSITSIRISSSTANNIKVGSRFQLYRINGEEEQTWSTT